MAEEQYVTRDQHRADMADLRGELKEEIAGLRQDVAVLAKTMEHLGQTMVSGFTEIRQAISALNTRLDRQEETRRQDMSVLNTRLDRQEETRRQDMSVLNTRLDRQEAGLRQEIRDVRQEIRDVRTTNQRQLWVLIGVVIVTMVGGMIKVVFFP
jgi:chromosome segregation ATPase